MADHEALIQVMAAKDSYDFLGSPEGDYAIANKHLFRVAIARFFLFRKN